ncbi:MAG: hypothetical protein E2576_06915 [Alcaligenaceae bacterium]|nr:hypothetical protein [Alcaligenaceae bacterium SAGV5]MPS53349.1 hypothetical protein [Alcaligenaceae bacterium SAGV3]MPT56443.1 hypothetical protein [Alcaligenaceae bacterium]
MASPSAQTVHLAPPASCPNCGRARIVHATGEKTAPRRTFASTPQLAIYVANLLLIGGAIAISVQPESASSPLIFGGFLAGHICLGLYAILLRERGLLFLNAALAALDLYAVLIRL